MSLKPEEDPLRAIDTETFNALRKDPSKLDAHLNGILAAVHARMKAPFQKERPLNYQVFPKKPVIDLTALVPMPGVLPRSEPLETTAPPAAAAPTPPPTAPESAHPPTPKTQSPPMPTSPRGFFVDSADHAAPRGVFHESLPDVPVAAPLAADLPPAAAVVQTAASETPATPVAAASPTAETLAPKQADAAAVQKRFEARQASLEDLFKDKGKLT